MPSQQSSSTTKKVEQKAGQVMDQAEQQAGHLTDKAKQQATSQVETRKNQAAEELKAVADATRQASQQLRKQQHDMVAHYADMAAKRLDSLAQTLRQRSTNQMLSDAEQMARKRPELFVGGAFAVGLLGARFLKSSSPTDGGGASEQARTRYSTGAYPPSTAAADVSGVPEYPTADTTTYSPYSPGTEG